MGKTKVAILAFLFLLQIFPAQSQNKVQKKLEVGDTFPALKLNLLEHGKHVVINNRSLKGKLVILDFWNVHCSSCIAEFPRLDSLQHIFDGKILIILITKDTDREIEKLFSRIKIPQPSLPMLNADSLLHSMFRIELFPGQVWIGTSGLIEQTPRSQNANKETLEAYLSGNKATLLQRGKIDFHYDQALLPQLIRDSGILVRYSSILVQGMEERGARSNYIGIDPNNSHSYVVKAINQPLYVLYRIAFERDLMGENYNFFSQNNNTRVILNVPADGFKNPPKELSERDYWARTFCYTYELTLPLERKTCIFDQMKADLKSNFGYYARIEKRNVKCAILVNSCYKEVSDQDTSKNTESFYRFNPNGFTLNNSPIKNLIDKILVGIYSWRKLEPIPVIDETGITRGINLTIAGDLKDLNNIRKQLNRYGLDVIEAERKIDMLVISERENSISIK